MKYVTFIFLILFSACNNERVSEERINYIEKEDEAVLNELFKQKKDVVSRSSAKVDLYKTSNNEFAEEIGQIYWYHHWTFDTLKNEYVPSGNFSSKIYNDNRKITLWQEIRSEGIEYYDHDEIQEWFCQIFLIVKRKNKDEQQYLAESSEITLKNRGWLFTKITEFTFKTITNNNEFIYLDANCSVNENTDIKELSHTKKYFCKFNYSNILLSPNNEEVLRELGEL